jgi:cyanate permease
VTQTQRRSRYRFTIEGLILAIQLSLGLSWMAVAPLFPAVMDEQRVDRATVSLLIAAISLITATLTIPAGIVGARFGLKRTMAVGAVFMAAGLLTPLTHNFTTLLATRIVFGLGVAIAFPLVAAIVMQWFESRELPLINGLNMVGSSLGISISLWTTIPLANALGGWRGPLTLFGSLSLGAAAAWIILGRERHIDQGTDSSQSTTSFSSIFDALRQKTTFLIGLGFLAPASLYMSLSAWLPTYYHEVFNMSLAEAGFIMGILFSLVGGISGSIAGAVLPSVLGRRKPFIIIPGLLIAFAGFGTYAFNSTPLIYVSVVAFGFLGWVCWPPLMTIAMELPGMTPSLVAVVIAAASSMSNIVGFISPTVVGYLADTTGSYLPGFLIWTVVSVGLAIAGFLLPETGPAAKQQSALVSESR